MLGSSLGSKIGPEPQATNSGLFPSTKTVQHERRSVKRTKTPETFAVGDILTSLGAGTGNGPESEPRGGGKGRL